MKSEFKPRINLEGRTPLETVIPLQTPYVVFVDPASACNFICKFCPTGHRDLIDDTGRYQGVMKPVSYTHLRPHETALDLVRRLLLEKQKHTTISSHLSRFTYYRPLTTF